jgi:choline kinase
MKAVMLAAGRGTRLFGAGHGAAPKALLTFEGRTLLQRHVQILRRCRIDNLTLVTGYQAQMMDVELASIGAGPFVRTIFNPQFEKGPIVSLWCARETLRAGDDVIFMDADVLYHPALIERLRDSPLPNCFLFDRRLDPGDDPVMVCICGGNIVDFGKQVPGRFDSVGEWPGFMKMTAHTAARLADTVQSYIDAGDLLLPYEPAIRDILLGLPPRTFGVEDISGYPWIEIDYPEDLERARWEILPRLHATVASWPQAI